MTMTHDSNPTPAEELLRLDKLVDGELDDAQRRQLLTDLENQPEGWRRCALAFLEAQAWKRSLAVLTAAPAQDARPRPARKTWWTGPLGSVLAAAASFLIAFALGLAWRGQAVRDNQLATNQPAGNQRMSPTPSAPGPAQPEFGLASDTPQWSTMIVDVDRDGDGNLEPVELPIVRGKGFDEDWVRSQPAAFPPALLRLFERMGHEVRHERQYYPFDLGDGRRVLVPVDDVDVRYGGERQFQ
jgi:hypothetical protein